VAAAAASDTLQTAAPAAGAAAAAAKAAASGEEEEPVEVGLQAARQVDQASNELHVVLGSKGIEEVHLAGRRYQKNYLSFIPRSSLCRKQ
jgi:hypothetical protein